jgi:NDP-sugar pyrophosphorylase family protein
MSKALLICPSTRAGVPELSRTTPLAAAPLLGESLLEYWLSHLALAGVKEVRILADDRPEQISKVAGDGARWGLKVEVTPEVREFTPAQAQIKYASEFPATGQNLIAVIDHFPGAQQWPLFTNHVDLFTALMLWMPRAKTMDRVGVREVRPGIWLGLHAQVSPDAQLRGPCWIGQHVYVGAHTVVGPNAIIEDRSFLEAGAEIVHSVIGPDTFVGRLAALQKSFAWGSTLVNWETDSVIQVPDAFLLCGLKRAPNAKSSEKFLYRLFDLLFTEPQPQVDPLDTIKTIETIKPINEQGGAT